MLHIGCGPRGSRACMCDCLTSDLHDVGTLHSHGVHGGCRGNSWGLIEYVVVSPHSDTSLTVQGLSGRVLYEQCQAGDQHLVPPL